MFYREILKKDFLTYSGDKVRQLLNNGYKHPINEDLNKANKAQQCRRRSHWWLKGSRQTFVEKFNNLVVKYEILASPSCMRDQKQNDDTARTFANSS